LQEAHQSGIELAELRSLVDQELASLPKTAVRE
jgi:hypothetical protein